MAITRRPERLKPAMDNIPKIESIQRIKRTPAISLKGVGKILKAQLTTRRISKSQSVINRPFMEKRLISGIARPFIWMYPKNQSIIKIAMSAPIIY